LDSCDTSHVAGIIGITKFVGMGGYKTYATDNACMLDMSSFVKELGSDSADFRADGLRNHFPKPATLSHNDIVINQSDHVGSA
jgi:hypothetical protein